MHVWREQNVWKLSNMQVTHQTALFLQVEQVIERLVQVLHDTGGSIRINFNASQVRVGLGGPLSGMKCRRGRI